MKDIAGVPMVLKKPSKKDAPGLVSYTASNKEFNKFKERHGVTKEAQKLHDEMMNAAVLEISEVVFPEVFKSKAPVRVRMGSGNGALTVTVHPEQERYNPSTGESDVHHMPITVDLRYKKPNTKALKELHDNWIEKSMKRAAKK